MRPESLALDVSLGGVVQARRVDRAQPRVEADAELQPRQRVEGPTGRLLALDLQRLQLINTLTRDMRSRLAFTLEVKSLDALQRALALVRDVRGVVSATRR